MIKIDCFYCNRPLKLKAIDGGRLLAGWKPTDPIKTALREAREEIGVEVELIDLIGVYTADRGNGATGIGFVFRGKVLSGRITPRQGEIMDFKFFAPQEVDDLIEKDLLYKPEYNLKGIKDWMNGSSYPLGIIKQI